VTSTHCKPPNS